MARPTVLLADDDRAICTVLSQAIRREGYNVVTTDDAGELLDWVVQGKGDLVITDVVMPKGNGLDFLPHIKRARPDLPVIIISANTTLMTAVKANQLGACEYFPKPFDLDALVGCVQKSLSPLQPANDASPLLVQQMARGGARGDDDVLVGQSPAMQRLYKVLARIMQVDLTVMLHGESGTGKELVARALHRLSPRRDKPFVAVNMAALPRELVESELFGHEKGAFTGATARKAGRLEQAGDGTLFLDGIGDMPLEAQTRLLHALQTQEYTPVGGTQPRRTHARIICATHRDLGALVRAGEFREDVYFRLNEVPVKVPSLRERKEDIEALALHCLAKAQRKGLPAKRLSTDAVGALCDYDWPGNVRELENLLLGLAALVTEPVLDGTVIRDALARQSKPIATMTLMPPLEQADAEDAARMGGSQTGNMQAGSLQAMVEGHMRQYFAAHEGALPASGLYERVLAAVEAPLLRVTMQAVDGHQLRAAEVLGINRNTLRKKLREHGITPFDGTERGAG